MDSLSSSTSHRSLSVAISILMEYLHQHDRGNRQWLNIKPHILNGLNTILSEGQFKGYSALFILASRTQGNQLLKNDNELRSKITTQGLNAVIAEGEYKGTSALFFLAASHDGRQLLKDDPNLLGKFTSVGLNAVIAEGEDKGKSALFFLAANDNGQQLLKDDSGLRGKITADGLNAFIPEGKSEGYSALFWLASSPEGRQLLISNAELRGKITARGLNAVVAAGPDKGKSALFFLVGNNDGRQLLEDDADLLGKVTNVGLNTIIAEGEDKGKSVLFFLAANTKGRQLLKDDAGLRGQIIADSLNALIPEGESEGYSALFCLASSPEGRQLLIGNAELRGKITARGLNAVVVEGPDKDKSVLSLLASNPEGRQLLKDDADLMGKVTSVGLNAVITKGPFKGYSALWFLASSPDGWTLLRDQKSFKDNIKLECLVSMSLHHNNDGSVKQYSVLAHILEDKNKHAVLFDNTRLMTEISQLVTSHLTAFVSSTQESNDQTIGNYIVKLLLENTPGRLNTILHSQGISSDNFRTYLNMNPDMINVMAKSIDGRSMIKEYTTFYPKKPHNGFFVPDNVRQEIKDRFTDNLDIVTDQVSQDIVINPVKITQEDPNIHEYRDIYWWLLVNRTHPITREPVALEVGQDPDDVLVFDEEKMQAIKELLKTWLHENMHEKLVDIIQDQEGIDFLLAFSDTVENLDRSVLQQSIVDGDENNVTLADYLQRSESGKELSRVIGVHNGRNSPISVCGFFDNDTGVDQNPSRSNYSK